MIRSKKLLSACGLSILLASCSATTARNVRSDPEIFRVGEIEVRLYSDRDAMVRSLPPIFALLTATRIGNTQIQVSGYYDKENKRIYSINDARTVLHEFKHYLEPEWRHEMESFQKSPSPQNSVRAPHNHTPVAITQTETNLVKPEARSGF